MNESCAGCHQEGQLAGEWARIVTAFQERWSFSGRVLLLGNPEQRWPLVVSTGKGQLCGQPFTAMEDLLCVSSASPPD